MQNEMTSTTPREVMKSIPTRYKLLRPKKRLLNAAAGRADEDIWSGQEVGSLENEACGSDKNGTNNSGMPNENGIVKPVFIPLLDEAKNLRRGERLELGIFDRKILLSEYHKNSVTSLTLKISFRGTLHLKVGVWRDGHNYTWLTDKVVRDKNDLPASIDIDVADIVEGNLEFKILAMESSQITSCRISSPARLFADHEEESATLCNFIFPKKNLCTEEPLYFHLHGATPAFSIEEQRIMLQKGDSVDFGSYFNSFSACKWQKYTNVDKLALSLDFSGKIEVELYHLIEDLSGEPGKVKAVPLCLGHIQHKTRASRQFYIGQYPSTDLIACRVRALGTATIYGGGFSTPCAITQQVKLGISITTFKREKEVKASAGRIASAIAANAECKDKVTLTVVDNGQTLTLEDVPGATLIPNRNFGGSGGFMRGLIHYQDLGEGHTHCLFMDDDASCETEAIFRALAFIEHAKDDNTAISGAMLSGHLQFVQWENGAWFDHHCRPLKCNFDLRASHSLINNEKEDADVSIYGAWWFFAFPIKNVKNYTFPFFLRGDDVQFSYINDFKITTLNGVSSWQDSFALKESPLTLYFDIRSHILNSFLVDKLKPNMRNIVDILWFFMRLHADSYKYDTAKSILISFKDFMKGPNFWVDNLDTQNIRERIRSLSQIEKPKPLTRSQKQLSPANVNVKNDKWSKIVRKFTFNGHLLPRFLTKRKRKWMLYKEDTPNPDRCYLYDSLTVVDRVNRTYYVLERSPKRYFGNLLQCLKLTVQFIVKYKSLKKAYESSFAHMTSKEFWQKAMPT